MKRVKIERPKLSRRYLEKFDLFHYKETNFLREEKQVVEQKLVEEVDELEDGKDMAILMEVNDESVEIIMGEDDETVEVRKNSEGGCARIP